MAASSTGHVAGLTPSRRPQLKWKHSLRPGHEPMPNLMYDERQNGGKKVERPRPNHHFARREPIVALGSDDRPLKFEWKAPLCPLPALKYERQTRPVLFVVGLPPDKSGIMQVVSGPRAAAREWARVSPLRSPSRRATPGRFPRRSHRTGVAGSGLGRFRCRPGGLGP